MKHEQFIKYTNSFPERAMPCSDVGGDLYSGTTMEEMCERGYIRSHRTLIKCPDCNRQFVSGDDVVIFHFLEERLGRRKLPAGILIYHKGCCGGMKDDTN